MDKVKKIKMMKINKNKTKNQFFQMYQWLVVLNQL